jgi:hypothetical protein
MPSSPGPPAKPNSRLPAREQRPTDRRETPPPPFPDYPMGNPGPRRPPPRGGCRRRRRDDGWAARPGQTGTGVRAPAAGQPWPTTIPARRAAGPWQQQARDPNYPADFVADVAAGTLPHVSWIHGSVTLETLVGVPAPNVSVWRRDTVGDMTSALALGQPARPAPPRYLAAARSAAHPPGGPASVPSSATPAPAAVRAGGHSRPAADPDEPPIRWSRRSGRGPRVLAPGWRGRPKVGDTGVRKAAGSTPPGGRRGGRKCALRT